MNKSIFRPGDVVWVPSTTKQGGQELWPAKFLRQTNRPDICMVSLYSMKPDEQFLVDTEEILAFDKHQTKNSSPDMVRAYQLAMKDLRKSLQQRVEPIIIKSSIEFCEYIQSLLLNQLLETPSQTAMEVPKFANNEVPLSNADLKIYFNRSTCQMISYLLETRIGKSEVRSFIEEARNQIYPKASLKLSKFEISFEN